MADTLNSFFSHTLYCLSSMIHFCFLALQSNFVNYKFAIVRIQSHPISTYLCAGVFGVMEYIFCSSLDHSHSILVRFIDGRCHTRLSLYLFLCMPLCVCVCVCWKRKHTRIENKINHPIDTANLLHNLVVYDNINSIHHTLSLSLSLSPGHCVWVVCMVCWKWHTKLYPSVNWNNTMAKLLHLVFAIYD